MIKSLTFRCLKSSQIHIYWIFFPPKNVSPFFLDLGWVSKPFSRHTQHCLHGDLSNSVKAASIATRAMMVRESGSEVKRYEKTANQRIIFGAFKRKHVCGVECLGTYIFQDKRGVGDNHPAEWWWLDYLFECYRMIPCYSFVSGWITSVRYFSERPFPKHQWFRMLLLRI